MADHRMKRSQRVEKVEVDKDGNEIKVIKYEDNTIQLRENEK